MNELSPLDKRILEEIQQDIPLVSRPFQEIAKRVGSQEDLVLKRIQELKELAYIRDISAIYNASGLGYKSTLVALSSTEPDKIALCINKHPGVSHNYYREHEFNVWFTLTIGEEQDFNSVIENMLSLEEYRNFRVLPSLKTFKIGVNFRFSTQKEKKVENHYSSRVDSVEINKDLIRLLQNPFPLDITPWESLSKELNLKVENLYEQIETLKKAKVIKRISGVLRHRKAGYAANGMACFQISDNQIDEAGRKASEYSAVSHCYQRPVYPDWPYSLFAMTHGHSQEQCEEIINEISREIAAEKSLVLYSTKEYKKERVKYFMEEIHV